MAMRKINKRVKLLVILFIVPLYLFNLVGEYWETKAYVTSKKFNFNSFNRQFYRELKEVIKYDNHKQGDK